MMIELLKIILPAVIVFGTVYFMLDKYFKSKLQHEQMAFHTASSNKSMDIKLQAYERLILFCDRIAPQALIYRLKDHGMTVGGLKTALLIAIQQEYEHNMAQQIYVSDKLWEIISVAKNEVQNLISKAAEDLSSDANADLLVDNISKIQGAVHFEPNEQAKFAIKEEVKLII